MENEIVIQHFNEPRAGTFLIAKGFKREHKSVTNLIIKYKERFIRLENNKSSSKGLIISKVPTKIAGRPIEEYLLNEAQTIFLGTIFRNSEIVLDFKEKIAREFVKIKKENYDFKKYKTIPEYNPTRNISKMVRKQSASIIETFIEYAKEQGGSEKGCDLYYSNITKMINSMLFIVEGKFKNIREVLTIPQLMIVSSADGIVSNGLRKGMRKGLYYKDIYKAIKADVSTFAELHGRSEVINMQNLIE